MRFVQYLACATLVARADVIEEDDDLHFMRGLQASNTTNATTTPTPTTATPDNSTTTTTLASSEETTSAATTTPAPTQETTSAKQTGEGTTQSSNQGTTNNPGNGNGSTKPPGTGGSDATMPPKSDAEVAAASADESLLTNLIAAAANANNTNGTGTTSAPVDLTVTVDVDVSLTIAAADPFFCGFNPSDASCTGSSGNSTRRLATDAEKLSAAHNLFCAAFSFTSSVTACEALGTAALKNLFQASTSAAGQNNCVSGMTLAYKKNTENCYVTETDATAAAALEGACFVNKIWKPVNSDGITLASSTWACTKSVGTTKDRTFETKTKITIPAWKVDAVAADSGNSDAAAMGTLAADASTITSTAQTAATTSATGDLLTKALVIAAVAIKSDPQIATVVESGGAVNITETLGMSEAQLDAVTTAGTDGGGIDSIAVEDLKASDGGNMSAALTTALTAATSAVTASYTVTNNSPTGSSGSTADASTIMVASSVVIGFLSLVF